MVNRLLNVMNDSDAAAADYCGSIQRRVDELQKAAEQTTNQPIIDQIIVRLSDAIDALIMQPCLSQEVRQKLHETRWFLGEHRHCPEEIAAHALEAISTILVCPYIQKRMPIKKREALHKWN